MNDKKPIRILFLGSGRTGKTSIIKRFLTNNFVETYHPTVEDIFHRECFVRNCIIDIEILDTGGFYNFIGMRKIYIKTSVAFVLTFSQDSYSSFEMCKDFYAELYRERGEELCSIPFVVVCNKSDTIKVEVGEIEIMDWLISSGLKPSQFVYCSAKKNENIIDIFESLWTQNYHSKTPLEFIDLGLDKKHPRRFSTSEMNKLELLSMRCFSCSPTKMEDNQENAVLESSAINIPFPSQDDDSCWTQSPTKSVNNHLRSDSPSEIKLNNGFFRSSLRLKRHSTKCKRRNRNQIHLNCTIS